MLVLGTIWARGEGSTLRRKNARKLCGKPMIYWALKNAMDAGFIDKIFVFTEDEEIAGVTRDLGGHVVERPKEMIFYHGGFTKPAEWGEYFLSKIVERTGSEGDIRVSLNCNICLLTGESLRRMYIKLMEDELAELIFPVVPVEPHLYTVNPETGYLFPIWEDPGLDRQKFPKLYRRIGINIGHQKRAEKSVFQKRLYHVIPFEESLDIHTVEDLALSEMILEKRLLARPEERIAV